ncbi:MAG: OmpA family protein [Bdellovibrionaceae bacterium]|nr:OmpA family protein [Pseudobdellovibrionaceae bacterium]
MKIKLTLALLFLQISVFANFVGNDTQNFNPIPSGLDFVTVHSSETLLQGFFNSGIFINYGKNSLPNTQDEYGKTVSSKDSTTFTDLSFAYGIIEDLDFGLSLSYLNTQETNRDVPGAQFAGTGLNEIRLLGKYRWQKRDPTGIALVTSMNFNQSLNNPFAGTDSGPTLNIEGIVDHKLGNFLLAGNLGYRMRSQGKPISGALFQTLPNQVITSLAASYYLNSADLKLIAELFAAKSTETVPFIDSEKISSEFLFGVKYDAHTYASFHFGAGTQVSDGLFTPDWRIYTGLNMSFDILHIPTSRSSPSKDSRPIQKTTYTYQGYQPRDIVALKEIPFDTLAKNHEFYLGTTVPETDFSGIKPPFEIIRLDNFDFDFGSSKIRPEYYPLLNRLAAYIGSNPPVIKIRVEGHTDSLGSEERNRKRSQSRADAVTDFIKNTGLISHVVTEPVGMGASRPIADNSNFQGRQQNRRVEIRILRQIPAPPFEKIETE